MWLRSNPKAIILVTVDSMLPSLQAVVRDLQDPRVLLYSSHMASMRGQLCEAIHRVETKLFVKADDRSVWSPRALELLVVPFADATIGGVNTLQEVIPTNGSDLTVWESFGALNLVRRNILHSALAYFNQGQVLNLSGRLVAYRTHIFQDEIFYHSLLHEHWLGAHHIITGDDNALHLWAVQKGWRTYFQNSQEAILRAQVCPDANYLRQLLRWSRDTARYYCKDLLFSAETCHIIDIKRALLNFLANYASDVFILNEISFLSMAHIVWWQTDQW